MWVNCSLYYSYSLKFIDKKVSIEIVASKIRFKITLKNNNNINNNKVSNVSGCQSLRANLTAISAFTYVCISYLCTHVKCYIVIESSD